MHVSEMVAEDSAEDWHSYRSQNTTDTREDTFTWCRNDHTALFCKIIIVFYYLTLRISTWGGRELICIEHLDKKPDALQLSLYLLIMVLPHLQGRIKKLAHEQVTPSRYWNSFVSWLKRSSVQFSYSAVSDFLQSHGLQHSRLPCPSPTPGACSNSCPSSWWCHPTNQLILCFPFLLPSIFPGIRVFSNESALHIRWPKYWSFRCTQIHKFSFCLSQPFLKSLSLIFSLSCLSTP